MHAFGGTRSAITHVFEFGSMSSPLSAAHSGSSGEVGLGKTCILSDNEYITHIEYICSLDLESKSDI